VTRRRLTGTEPPDQWIESDPDVRSWPPPRAKPTNAAGDAHTPLDRVTLPPVGMEALTPELYGFDLTEDGAALAFAATHDHEFRFCHGPNRWHRWDGTRWKPEPTRLAFESMRQTARRMGDGADQKLRATLGKAAFATGVERFAISDRRFAVTPDRFDRDPWLLGTPGGTIDLMTGELRPPDPEDYISKQTSVTPAAPGTPCPLWDAFLDFVTRGNDDLRRFLQQILGYCLTGDVTEECIFFCFGHGMNGKGTLIGAAATILGDYAVAADMQTFTLSKYDRHPTELAKLAGARLVTATETERGRTWAWSRIKELTGNETKMSARFMRRDFFEFAVTFKLLFAGNHKPRLPAADEATARRMRLIPFDNRPEKPDFDLKLKLVAEHPAILRWMIDGCLDWRANRLMVPDVVTDATDAYLEEQDLLRQWIDSQCVTGPGHSATSAALFHSWRGFCLDRSEEPGTETSWAERMAELGTFTKVRHTPGYPGQRGWKGIALWVQPLPSEPP
jgi:putative DNA primase/helicase